MNNAKIIVLEGIDTSGKSTQLKLIDEYLRNNNIKTKFLHFPMYGHNDFSKLIAKFLQGDLGNIDEVDPYFVANIYAMDRYMYLPELKKLMSENDVIILDRYVFSNIAFQCAKVGMKNENMSTLKNWILKFEFNFLKLPYPELTLFLDIPMEVAEKRLQERKDEDRDYLEGKQDIHEADMKFQNVVKNVYLTALNDQPNYKIVKCANVSDDFGDTHWNVLSPDELFNSYKKEIDFHILNHIQV